MVLLIDNYDSFSYNVYQLVGSIREDIRVIRNDAMTVPEIEKEGFDHIILSPGPGYPKDAGVCEDVIKELAGKIPMLGICLGHQAICEVFGAKIVHARELMHGKKSEVSIDNSAAIFKGLPEKLEAARYHSLAADPDTLPDTLKVLGRTADGEIMAVKHKDFDIYGMQFHPESILTQKGREMLENFLRI
ncbi:MAG: aminodeoxychorismate/anthranilate synthase component II [Lachnospiraceae bacterium]|nr:aminodeoxychorismate/anthranilate synthase component II [Lachnospiraceae bacterium]